jgi:hypothetical protein
MGISSAPSYTKGSCVSEGQTERLLVCTKTGFMAFHGNIMKQDRFYHILRFSHFSDNKKKNLTRQVKFTTNYGKRELYV